MKGNGQQAAEQLARQQGYSGPFPPPPLPRVENIDELREVLARMDRGELSANVVRAATSHIMSFFRALEPARFQTVAETLIAIVLFEDEDLPAHIKPWVLRHKIEYPAPRVRIRALQGVLKPMLKMLEMLPKLMRQRGTPSESVAHLLKCIYAFMHPFRDGVMERVANKMLDMAIDPTTSAENAVRAGAAAAELVTGTLGTILSARLGVERAAEECDDELIERIRAEFEGMCAEVDAGVRRAREAKCSSA